MLKELKGMEYTLEILRAFQLRGRLRRPEDAQPAAAEDVDDAGGERRFRSDDGQRHLHGHRQFGQRVDIGGADVADARVGPGGAACRDRGGWGAGTLM